MWQHYQRVMVLWCSIKLVVVLRSIQTIYIYNIPKIFCTHLSPCIHNCISWTNLGQYCIDKMIVFHVIGWLNSDIISSNKINTNQFWLWRCSAVPTLPSRCSYINRRRKRFRKTENESKVTYIRCTCVWIVYEYPFLYMYW